MPFHILHILSRHGAGNHEKIQQRQFWCFQNNYTVRFRIKCGGQQHVNLIFLCKQPPDVDRHFVRGFNYDSFDRAVQRHQTMVCLLFLEIKRFVNSGPFSVFDRCVYDIQSYQTSVYPCFAKVNRVKKQKETINFLKIGVLNIGCIDTRTLQFWYNAECAAQST